MACPTRFQGEQKDYNGNWARGHSGYILAKNLAAFNSCPDILGKAEFKSNQAIILKMEMSR